jgi:hypothetical protein
VKGGPLLLLALAASVPAGAALADQSVAVLAVGEAPAGPGAELSELTHQLRAACRDRAVGVLDLAETRSRLLGQPSAVRLAELDRAAGAAIADYQAGEYQRAILIWRAVVEELEKLQAGPETYEQWTRAVLRLAHAEGTLNHWAEARASMEKLLAVEPRFAPDPDEYSPSYRRVFDEVRQKLRGRPLHRLTITGGGRSGAAFVNGKAIGATPATVALPAGRYRVAGSSGGVRAPGVTVDLRTEDREVDLALAFADAVRLESGPGLALSPTGRAEVLREAGAALGVERLVAASLVNDGEGAHLSGALYDVGRGTLLREGRVRVPAGAAQGAGVGALASFLLRGQPLQGVVEVVAAPAALARGGARAAPAGRSLSAPLRVPAPEPVAAPEAPQSRRPIPTTRAASSGGAPGAPPTAAAVVNLAPTAPAPSTTPATAPPQLATGSRTRLPPSLAPAPVGLAAPTTPAAVPLRPAAPATWLRPAAWLSGTLALGFAGVAAWQGLAASSAYDRANGMVRPDGLLVSGNDPTRYRDALNDGDRASRLAWVSAGSSVALAAAAGFMGWLSADVPPSPR